MIAQWSVAIGPNIADASGNVMDGDGDGIGGEIDDAYRLTFLGGGDDANAPDTSLSPRDIRVQQALAALKLDAEFQSSR
jgi:hypothetical protein